MSITVGDKIFKCLETSKILDYIKQNYDGVPEFLWAKDPNSAAFRHKGNLKWYALILQINKQKLGLKESEYVDIMDLKCEPMMIGSFRDGIHFFPAYHMNKEHWITILIDKDIDLKKVFNLIDLSFEITRNFTKK